jgi:hypothetical protein
VILVSCQPIMKKLYGIKKPDVENEKTISKKLLKYKLDTSSVVTVSSKEFLNVINGQSIPDGLLYDGNGKYIEYRQTDSSCNAGLFQFIPELNLTDKYNQPDSVDNLFTKLNKFRDLKGNMLELPEKADFYLVIYWTVWTGKLNKNHVKIWEDLALNNKNCKIKVIKVNLDIQEYWEEKARINIIETMSRKK